MRKVVIDGNSLTPERVAEVALNRAPVEIAPEVHERLAAGRAYICLLYTSPSPRDP